MTTTTILREISDTPWAILRSTLGAMIEQARAGVRSPASAAASTRAGQVAVVPLSGPLTQRGGGLLGAFFAGTSTEWFIAAIRQCVADPSIRAIVIDVASPGGTVFGVHEAADELYHLRGTKPIIAAVTSQAASAAYWIASNADEMMITPSGECGSIGVFAIHQDLSAMAEKAGIRMSVISAGRFKTEGSEFEPLTDEARAAIQARVDDYYSSFVAAVARGRGVAAETVRVGFGQGRIVGAKRARTLGMVDSIGTLSDAITRAASVSPSTIMGARSSDAWSLQAHIIEHNARFKAHGKPSGRAGSASGAQRSDDRHEEYARARQALA